MHILINMYRPSAESSVCEEHQKVETHHWRLQSIRGLPWQRGNSG